MELYGVFQQKRSIDMLAGLKAEDTCCAPAQYCSTPVSLRQVPAAGGIATPLISRPHQRFLEATNHNNPEQKTGASRLYTVKAAVQKTAAGTACHVQSSSSSHAA